MKRTILLAMGIVLASIWFEKEFRASPVVDAGTVSWAGTGVIQSGFAGGGLSANVREITAYNVGVPEQTSSMPCIGAMGIDLCRLVEQGWKVCAANFVEFGTILKIEGYGEYHVLDRMNSRYPYRVDIAMRKEEVRKAVVFGLQQRVVEVKQGLRWIDVGSSAFAGEKWIGDRVPLAGGVSIAINDRIAHLE